MVRVVAGPDRAVIDYREKLPGRAAYVCLRSDCIKKACEKDTLSRALHLKVKAPTYDAFLAVLMSNITEKAGSLIAMAAKAGRLSAGYSAVQDAMEKGRVVMLLYARDIAQGTKEKIEKQSHGPLIHSTLFTRDELGKMLGRELVGVIGIEEKGLADALWKETERLKNLINMDK
jgi:predicted RNA-binding protein YlxR (DUF448 family)